MSREEGWYVFDEQVSPTPMPVLVRSRHHTVKIDGSQAKGYSIRSGTQVPAGWKGSAG